MFNTILRWIQKLLAFSTLRTFLLSTVLLAFRSAACAYSSAPHTARPDAVRAHAQNVAMLGVLGQVLMADLQMSRKGRGSNLRRYISSLIYVDVSRCPTKFQSNWAAYLKTCVELDHAARAADCGARKSLGLVKDISFGTANGRDGWKVNASGLGRSGAVSTPRKNFRINALDAAQDDHKFALEKLCAAALTACSADSRQEYLQGLLLNYQLCFTERQFAVAFQSVRKAAEFGDSNAMDCVGGLYRQGLGVKRDYRSAMAWYRRAVAAGIGDAMEGIGDLYDKGQGAPVDYVMAMTWYKKSAAKGNYDAMFDVGLLYADGLGSLRNYTQAMHWWRKAAAAGSSMAMANIGNLYANALGVPQDYTCLGSAGIGQSVPTPKVLSGSDGCVFLGMGEML